MKIHGKLYSWAKLTKLILIKSKEGIKVLLAFVSDLQNSAIFSLKLTIFVKLSHMMELSNQTFCFLCLFKMCSGLYKSLFFVHEISCVPNSFRCTSMHVVHTKEQMCMLLTITWGSGRNCTKLVLKPLAS